MTYAQWRRAMFWGRIAHWIVLRAPDASLSKYPVWWLLPAAGFYAYSPDDGYEGYAARCTAYNQHTPAERLQ